MTAADLKAGALIAVDWGTSNFRATLLAADGAVIDRLQAPKGILHVERDGFPAVLTELLSPWLPHLPGVPVLMAGMIGSADGLVEVPYLACPASLDDIADGLVRVTPLGEANPAYIVPGLRGQSVADSPDVMRGEEIQILGALDRDATGEQILCLPGTHAKWVRLSGRTVQSFSTCMTGDAYSALRQHTILRRFAADGRHDARAFRRGLERVRRPGGLMHHLFSARTEVLLGDMLPETASAYLSGLLIGDEVRAMVAALQPQNHITLIGDPRLTALYAEALELHGQSSRCLDGDQAVIDGLYQLATRAGLPQSN